MKVIYFNVLTGQKLRFNKELSLDDKVPDVSHTQVDIKKQLELIDSYQGSEEQSLEDVDMEFGFMCQRLSDIISQPMGCGGNSE